jgi:hypothetical protein
MHASSELEEHVGDGALAVRQVADHADAVLMALQHQVVLHQHIGAILQRRGDSQLVGGDGEHALHNLGVQDVHREQVAHWGSALVQHLAAAGMLHAHLHVVGAEAVVEQRDDCTRLPG